VTPGTRVTMPTSLNKLSAVETATTGSGRWDETMLVFPLAEAVWQFRDATNRSGWRRAVVPGCVHRDLHRHRLIPDPFHGTNESDLQWIEHREWEYRAGFVVPDELFAREEIELCADGLDTLATVFLNGLVVARTDNMFVAYRWSVGARLRPGRNELVIRFGCVPEYLRTHRLRHRPRENHDPVGGGTKIRKQPCQFGWDWGPRFVTAGIWRDLRLEAWSGNRLAHVRLVQHHAKNGTTTLAFFPEFARPAPASTLEGTVSLNGRIVAKIENRESKIKSPSLWWPSGQGAQPLYDVEVIARDAAGREIGRWSRRVGLRTIALDRHRDRWGESFQFVVNGRPVFAKGANWIPAHSFVAGLTRADYARDLRAAAAANMNMIRVWGGGVYESEDFYDLCDELGLMVWQDFMFACTLPPGDRAFLASVRAEAEHQVRRLQHRACLALWCGNNEIAQLNADLLKRRGFHAANQALFHRVLPAAVAAHDGVTGYWPSSPWRGDGDNSRPAGERRGDTHFWDVWHLRKPVQEYQRWRFRFLSEFGMQSWSSPETNATFCPPGSGNLFGPVMESHQKNRAGNQIILDYVSRRYRFPGDQTALIYLSQLNQAHCMQVAVEHCRRHMPRCMGALYWQLNDCWPVASWSSIEFTGRWKALHFAARRFFAPHSVSAEVPGEETAGIGNYRHSSVDKVHLYTVSDGPQPALGALCWELRHVDGRVIGSGRRRVALRPRTSVRQCTLDLRRPLTRHGRDCVYLRIGLDLGGVRVSEDTVFLTPPRFVGLPVPITRVKVKLTGRTQARLSFVSPVFQHRFAFDLPGMAYTASDNFFELYPGERREVTVVLAKPAPASRLRRVLKWHSLAGSAA
jgi:beta-mannosidase